MAAVRLYAEPGDGYDKGTRHEAEYGGRVAEKGTGGYRDLRHLYRTGGQRLLGKGYRGIM